MSSHKALSDLIQRNQAADVQTTKLARYLVQRSAPNVAVLASDYTGPADTTLAVVPGLVIGNGVGFNGDNAVVGGRRYKFRLAGNTTCNGASGIKVDFQGGSCTFTSMSSTSKAFTASAIAVLAPADATTAAPAGTTAYTAIEVEGQFVAASSGTFAPRIACNAATTAPVLLAGMRLELEEIAS